MFTEIKKAVIGISVVSIYAAALVIAIGSSAAAERGTSPTAAPTPPAAAAPVFANYKNVAIGAKADDVRLKLGEPKDKSNEMDLYVFSEMESAQFYYDAAHLVTAIMITYSGDLKLAPSPKAVFGEEVPLKEDGSLFKMVRYPKAGFLISYNRGGGSDAVISIAMQKI